MMTASLLAAVDRGDPVSILIPARWPIYRRYGYGPAAQSTGLTITTQAATFAGPAPGGLAYTDRPTARAAADVVFDRFRAQQPGAISRRPYAQDIAFGLVTAPDVEPWKGYCVVHRDADAQPDGYLRYHVEDKWDVLVPDCTLVVDDLVAATPAAYQALWRLCCEMDNITTVEAADRSVAEPLQWLLTDARAVQEHNRSDFLWVRVLDTPAALSARTYLTEGRVVLEVIDPMGHAAGRFILEGGPDGATCKRTYDSPELTVSAFALGTVLLGGTRLRELAAGGEVAEHAPGALAKADAMFMPELTPWCNTWF